MSGLKQLKEANIRVYAVAGSHDFSPSGKTMLDVLEGAGLLVNVARGEIQNGQLRLSFSVDEKTGVKLTGLPGRRGTLESNTYGTLERDSLEREPGLKVFIFHSTLSEYKPAGYEYMDSLSLTFLPRGFSYYAGGHVHEPLLKEKEGMGIIAVPGPLFPNNFKEMESLGTGSMLVCEVADGKIHPDLLGLKVIDTVNIQIDSNNKGPEQVRESLLESLNPTVKDKLVLIRVAGTLSSGKPSEIDFNSVFKRGYDNGAFFIMKNTSELTAKEFEQVKVDLASAEEIEARLIDEHKSGTEIFGDAEREVVVELLKLLANERGEGETKAAYEERLSESFHAIMAKSIYSKRDFSQ